MGKRIPKSRRHKKLKFVDPCYTGEQPSTKKKKMLPNEPPTNIDYQDVPRHMTEVINLKNKIKAGKFKKKKRKKKVIKDDFIVVKNQVMDDDTQGSTRPFKSVPPVIKQKSHESEEKFMRRMNRMARGAIAEAKMEQKYGIQIVNIDKKGNAQYLDAPKEVTDKKREKRKKFKEKEDEKKKLKLDEEKFNLKREKIDLNDVAMAPPIFTAKPRKAPKIEKPGKKLLFLKNMFGDQQVEEKECPKPLTVKLKHMPLEKRKILENERLRAVQMYRMLKNKKPNA